MNYPSFANKNVLDRDTHNVLYTKSSATGCGKSKNLINSVQAPLPPPASYAYHGMLQESVDLHLDLQVAISCELTGTQLYSDLTKYNSKY